MARSDAVWGIDIGQYSLKALRCRPGDQPGRIVAVAFDFISYPKILSQPGANPEELISEALAQFLSRNSVRGDRVAISVSGQNGLARFIKLPPVESKKIPDIVRYEARQQIPFDLDDVVWDYQQMGGGAEEEGFVLETEIGLFAMKRDQVFRALEPFTTAGIDVDIVQLTPLALYNYVLFDQMNDLPPADEYDPDNPPPSLLVLSLGTDSTDLVVTNGYRVWQRSIPIGGNHFTKALTKELKLTFAKAEHLKCNATAAQDPKALFQAMRPVFNDLLTEIQRSIGYFSSIDRNATIEKVVALGGAMKMPGLRRYLAQSLGIEVVRIDSFRGLSGTEVLGAPAFKDNLVSYAVSYGLAVQGLNAGRGVLTTNLLPREIVKDRFIQSKKPWAIAAAAVLMLGFTISYGSSSIALSGVQDPAFKAAQTKCSDVAERSRQLKSEEETAKTNLKAIDDIGQHLIGNVENRIVWLELIRAVNECLPHEKEDEAAKDAADAQPEKPRKGIMERNELHITSFECQRLPSADAWIAAVKKSGWYQPSEEELAIEAANKAAMGDDPMGNPGMGDGTMAGGMGMGGGAMPGMGGGAMPGSMGGGAMPGMGMEGMGGMGMEGMGGMGMGGMGMDGMGGMGMDGGMTAKQKDVWIIQLTGYHYHNRKEASGDQGAQYVRDTLVRNLQEMGVYLPTGNKEDNESGEKKLELVSMKELGVSYPVLVNPGNPYDEKVIDRDAEAEANEDAAAAGAGLGGGKMGRGLAGMGMPGGEMSMGAMGGAGMGAMQNRKLITLRRFDFVVQFCWHPTPPTVRHQTKKKLEEAKAESGQFGDEIPGPTP